MRNRSKPSFLNVLYLGFICLFLGSCGGDEATESESSDASEKTEPEQPPKIESGTDSNAEEIPQTPQVTEKKIVPNPNGVYLPNGEEKNGQPVFENQEGFSMWFDSSSWKITDKIGGGKLISIGKATINDDWQSGATARFYPDEENGFMYISFPSADRNKVTEENYLLFKKNLFELIK